MREGIDGAARGGDAGSVGLVTEREIEEGRDRVGLGVGVLRGSGCGRGHEELYEARDCVRVRPDQDSVRGARLGELAELPSRFSPILGPDAAPEGENEAMEIGIMIKGLIHGLPFFPVCFFFFFFFFFF